MAITYDPSKRQVTLVDRGLDFEDAMEVFDGTTVDQEDDRRDYGEKRMITAGFLRDRLVILVWTQRGDDRHIISMRKANDREKARYLPRIVRRP
ncbi:MAG: BrnT family toxin [Bauldia sp.]|nr:BrnT family toxin [Bauldia sp.]